MRQDPNHYYDRVNRLREQLKTCRFVEHDERTLSFDIMRSRGGPGVPQALGARRFFANLTEEILDTLDEAERRVVAESAGQFSDVFRTIQTRQNNGTGGDIDGQTAQTLERAYASLSGVIAPALIARYLERESDFEAQKGRLREDVEAFLHGAREESQSLIAQVRADLTNAAITKNANFFHHEARRYTRLAIGWGIATAAWIIATLMFAWVTTFNGAIMGNAVANAKSYAPNVPDGWLIIQVISSKLIFIAMMTFVAVILVRGLMSSLNSQVTNRHRAVALDTYKFLLDGAVGEADRQAIIQRAAEAVFTIQETGLIKGVPGGEGNPLSTTINLPRLG